MDKLIEVLRGLLAEIGLDEPSQEAFINKLVAATEGEGAEENPQPSGDPAVVPTEGDVPPVSPVAPGEEGASELPPSEELPPDDVPPAQEGDPVPPQEEVNPQPPVPAFDPAPILAQIEQLTSENAELKKANEGALERIASLEEALKAAGIIDESNVAAQVGDPLPSADPNSPTEDALGSIVSFLNTKKTY